MKNQYFGDINDYRKYGLLRCFAEAGMGIGVCWMLTPDDGRSDGRKIEYLSNPEKWRNYDPILFDDLAKAINRRTRHVRRAQRSTLLSNALFFNRLVPNKQPSRERWLTKVLAKLARVDLLFFDPDNGIEVKSKPNGLTGSCKYLYWDEIRRAWSLGHSLLIFQHFSRERRDRHVSRLTSQLSEYAPGANVVPLITSNVVYLLAFQQRHIAEVGNALETLYKRWVGQFRRG